MLRFFKYSIVIYLVFAFFIWILHPYLLFRPTKLPPDFQYSFNGLFKEINFQPAKGVSLNALWFREKEGILSQNRGKFVLFFHGNRGNLARWGREYVERFTSRGYNVLMYDYRGYGKSTGECSEVALHQDAQCVYDFLKKQISEDSIVVYGYSLGTGMAARIAANNHPKMLILEAPYVSIPTLGRTQLPIFPYEWLTRYKFRTDSCFAHIRCPIHLFHGTKDITVPYKNSLILSTLAGLQNPSNVTLTTIPNGEHLHLDSFTLYHTSLDSLLGKALE